MTTQQPPRRQVVNGRPVFRRFRRLTKAERGGLAAWLTEHHGETRWLERAATAFGISVANARHHARRYGLLDDAGRTKRNTVRPKIMALLLRPRAVPMADAEIAALVGTERTYVGEVRRSLGIASGIPPRGDRGQDREERT